MRQTRHAAASSPPFPFAAPPGILARLRKGGLRMDGEASEGPGLRPLVPPPPIQLAADPVALHRHGVELIAAANRLAVAWLREATAQHAAMTRRALTEMTASAKALAQAEDASDQARVMLDALYRAQESGVATARTITGLMQRIQEDTADLLTRALPGTPPEE